MNLFRDQFSIVIFLLLFAGYEAANNVDEEAHEANELAVLDYRLPKTVVPTNYEITLAPELQNDFKFKGVVYISASLRNSTNTITLHHGRIDINIVSVMVGDQNENINSTTYNNKTEKYEIRLDKVLEAGTNITINFEYVGKLRDDMIGFYRSSYVDAKGQIRWLAATQFQTTHARHAFPCFDEPSFKATYDIRILRPAKYSCLSNMPLKRSVPQEDKYWDEFEHSVPMSTYLVAFVISDFGHTKVGDFKVWAKPSAVDQTAYALDIGRKGLDYLSKRFKQNYQLPKMDMVAVPDFSAGAMENWGLVTYRESRLLHDEKSTSDAAKQSIASVVIHELTHMWFGNMITPEWWGYLWLSEGFARYFQYFATAQIETTWNMEDQFLVEQHQTALAADGIETSLPMTRTVVNSSQIGGVGDTITYNKGASILRMINLVYGANVFDATLQNYLANNAKERVARPINFWNELENECKRENGQLCTQVEEIMTTWTEQAGFPVVSVTIDNGKVLLEQQRFLLRNLKSTPTNLTWWLPITWTTQQNPNFNQLNVSWINGRNSSINIDKSPGWVIFNVQSAGFYRVNYDRASWRRIINALNSDNYHSVHVLNRAALVDDLLNLARADLLDYGTALDGLRYLTRERDYLPFKAAFSALTYLDQRLSGENEYYKQFKQFVLILIENVYKDVGYVDRPSDDRLKVLLRGELNKWACNYGHVTCVQTFTKMFQQWTKNNATIKPNQRPVAYCTGVRYGTKEDWEFLWRQYYNSNSATEQVVILEALGCTRDKTLLEKHLLNALKNFEENRIRPHDHTAVFSAVYGSNIFGAEFVLDFVAKYHAEMVKFYNGTGTISSILSSASKRFSTVSLVEKYDSLIKNRKTEFKDIADSLNSSLELARYELQWLKRHTKAIASWVNDFHEQLNTISYRLPTSIIPNSYNIWINTNLTELDNFTFTGSVDINAIVTSRTKNITLHSVDLIHRNIRLYAIDKKIPIARTDRNEKYDFLIIHLSEELQVGQRLSISIEFTGHMNEEEMRGLYRSWYIDNGKKRWLAATHMEPVGARKMFPCFDEPAMKANFTMNVRIPQEYNATSNMPIKSSSSNENETKTITFQETPKMSTYLVALVISDFTSLKNESYKVWVRQNAIEDGKYALSLMKPLVSYYEGIVHIPYQLPKLDMVALPDFVSGAMENWGLLTYKERNLLFDRELSTTATKQSIANVIAHEIAHQWFGNLVSPKWWNYLWLNEGFARYFQYFAIHPENTKWSVEGQFVVEQVHSALEVDSSASTHPMTHDVWSPTQIRGIFDTISYGKAASVIRMIENVLGTKSFYEALEIYLRKRKYDAATPEDLFDAISEKLEDQEIKNSILDIMNSWTIQSGYPVVNATQLGNYLMLSQQRFFLNPEASSNESSWHIPITWTNLNEPNFSDTETKFWLKRDQKEIGISLPTSDLYLLNVRQAGFYRVNYSPDNWQNIIRILNSDRYRTIGEINRANIIDDLFNLARVKYVHYSTLLNATEYLVRENEYLPWRAYFNGLSYLHKQFEGKEGYKAFVRYVSSLLTPIYKNLQFEDKENSTHVELLFRSHVRKWTCKLDILDCKSKALNQFEAWSNNPTTYFSPNIRGVAYCAVAEQNDRKSWSRLWELYEQSTFSAEKLTILQSLACTTENAFLKELLQNALSKDKVRFEDSSSVFTSVINSGPNGVEFAMSFVEENYEKMLAHFKQPSNINSILNTIGKNVFTKKLLEKYVKLLNFLEERKVTREAKAYKSQAEGQLKWGEENVPRIFHWMEKHYPSADYRLPNAFTPSRYNLTLSPYFDNFTFTGRVQIEMTRNVDYVSHIVLHASDLSVTDLSLRAKNSTLDNRNDVMERVSNNNTQMITIFLEKFVQPDEFILDVTFEGILNDNMAGFYRSYYFDEEGDIHWLATTQFQPTHARRAFPCFDEPAFKANFTISVERPDNYQVLSNMDRDKSIPLNSTGRTIDVFRESVKMSTYLVAFIVSEFKSLEIDNYVGIWGRPNIVEKGSRAKNIATVVRDLLESETDHTYILPKLDLIGIPDMGDMGAMENWGLITFREYGLFSDENVTSTKQLDYIITIIAHEIAHSMFGNLVTCDWWEYVWLNEGFAQYMQWHLGALYAPNYGYEELFVVNELQAAMQEDALSTSHPMNNPASTPNEIKNAFDSIAYKKSASVIRMLRKLLKPETFKMAVSTYLENKKFRTAKPDDLWQAFDYAINKTNDLQRKPRNVSYFMSGWTNRRGYPVVSATMSDNGTITLSQKSFSTYKDIEDFWIPITMTTATERNFSSTAVKCWLQGYYDTISISSQEEWFVLNIQQSGYYRVNYDEKSWNRLIEALRNSNHTLIHATNRAQIVDDLLNLARAGWVDYKIALAGTTYLSKELHHVPWKAFFNGMSFLLQRYQGQKGEDLLKKYILLLATDVYNTLGFDHVNGESEGESHLDKLNRELILSWMCKLNHSHCVETSNRTFAEWKNTKNDSEYRIPPDAKVAIYCTAIRDGKPGDWIFLWDQYLNTNFASEKKIILDALGCSTDKKILYNYIERALVSNYTADVRKQDFNAVLASIYNSGEEGVNAMLDYVVNYYDRLHEYYGNWNDVGALISKLASRLSKNEQIRKLNELSTKEGGITNIAASINNGIAIAQENLRWYSNYSSRINSCLNEAIRIIEDKSPASTVVANNLAVALMTVFSLIVYIIN